jgi:hypothetical protein
MVRGEQIVDLGEPFLAHISLLDPVEQRVDELLIRLTRQHDKRLHLHPSRGLLKDFGLTRAVSAEEQVRDVCPQDLIDNDIDERDEAILKRRSHVRHKVMRRDTSDHRPRRASAHELREGLLEPVEHCPLVAALDCLSAIRDGWIGDEHARLLYQLAEPLWYLGCTILLKPFESERLLTIVSQALGARTINRALERRNRMYA